MKREMSNWEKEVRKALIDKNMNMTDLADQLGVSSCYLYDILNDNRPAVNMRQKINNYLGIEWSDE